MYEDSIIENLYNVRAFLGKDLSSILAKVYLDKHLDEKGKLHWISLDTTLELSNGTRTINMGIDFWDDKEQEEMLGNLRNMIEILTGFEQTIVDILPTYIQLRDEAKANRNGDNDPLTIETASV